MPLPRALTLVTLLFALWGCHGATGNSPDEESSSSSITGRSSSSEALKPQMAMWYTVDRQGDSISVHYWLKNNSRDLSISVTSIKFAAIPVGSAYLVASPQWGTITLPPEDTISGFVSLLVRGLSPTAFSVTVATEREGKTGLESMTGML